MFWIAARQPYPLTPNLAPMNGGEGTERLPFVSRRLAG
jgi:hypothetical protein